MAQFCQLLEHDIQRGTDQKTSPQKGDVRLNGDVAWHAECFSGDKYA